MASFTGEKADFSLTIGLNIDDLMAGMDEANVTIAQAIRRINAENKQIKLKADVSDLKNIGDEEKRQADQMAYLNRQIELQTAKLRLLGQAMESANKNAAGTSAAKNAENAYLSQEKYLLRLQNRLKELKAAQNTVSKSNMFDRIKQGAQGAAKGVDELKGGFYSLSGKAMAAMAIATTGAGLFNLTEAAMKSGEALYQMSNRLHTSTAEASNMMRVFSMAGADVGAIVPLFTRLDKTLLGNGQAATTMRQEMALFGFTLQDAHGNILPLNEQLGQLARGYQNAAAAGKEEEFVSQTLGARGAALVPILQNYTEYMQIASRIKTTGLLNPEEAHKTYLEWVEMNAEAGQLKSALGAALMPVAKELMPEVTDGMRELIGYIKDNKDDIKTSIEGWAEALGEVAGAAGDAAKAVGSITSAVQNSDIAKGLKNDAEVLKNAYPNANIDKGKSWAGAAGLLIGGIGGGLLSGGVGAGVGAMMGREIAQDAYTEIGKAMTPFKMWDYSKQKTELQEQEKQALKDYTDQKSKETEAENKNTSAQKNNANATQQSTDAQKKAIEAVRERATATGQLSEKIYALTHNDLENAMHDLDNKVEDATANMIDPDKIAQFKAASLAKIQRDFKKNVTEPMAQAFKTDLQNALDEVDIQKQDYLQKGASQEDADRWAAQRKAKITADWDRQVASQIDSVWHTEFENELTRIEQEKQAWIQKGLDEVKATQWAEEQKNQAQQSAAVKALTTQRKYLMDYRKAMAGAYGGDTMEERQQIAEQRMAMRRRRDLGIRPGDYITKDELQNFLSAYQRADRGIGVTDIPGNVYNAQAFQAAMQSIQSNQVEVLRGTADSMESGVENGSYKGVSEGISGVVEVLRSTQSSIIQTAYNAMQERSQQHAQPIVMTNNVTMNADYLDNKSTARDATNKILAGFRQEIQTAKAGLAFNA